MRGSPSHESTTGPAGRARRLAAVALALALPSALLVIGAPSYLGARASRAWNATPFHLGGSVPVVLQQRTNDCGPAVVATLLAWAGRPAPLATVTFHAELGPGGLSLAEFARLAHGYGLTGAWFQADGRTLERLGAPFVAHVRAQAPGSAAPAGEQGPAGAADLGHLVVVWAVGHGAVLLSDPAVGAYALPLAEFASRFTGRAYLLARAS